MFKDVDTHEHYYHVKENGKYGIGIYPVLFGFRVRVWELDNKISCIQDLCFGDNSLNVSIGYSVVKRFIENKGTPKDIPFQSKKPWTVDSIMNDTDEFNDWMMEWVRSDYMHREDFVDITQSDLNTYRQHEFNKVRL